MTIRRHPDEDVLFSYAVGAMAPGAHLVVEAHLETCAACRRTARFLDELGGALLATVPAEPLADGAVEEVVSKLTDEAAEPEHPPVDPDLPAIILRGAPLGPWRPVAPGLQVAHLKGAGGKNERVYLMKGRRGAAIPFHGHEGAERISVLQGAFIAGAETYRAGDYAQFARTDSHQLMVDDSGDCICLVATEGRLKLTGLGRLVQPLLGM